MRGVVFPGNSVVEVRDFGDPVPGLGEVVVKIRASGMCGSDLHFYRAPEPSGENGLMVIQGHEPCGEITAVGPGVPELSPKIGDRVLIHHYWGCGVCRDCRTGWPQLCTGAPPRIPTINEHGGHAEFMKVPALQTMPLRDELSFRAGAALSCGTGTAWGALVRLGEVAGKNLLVSGQGPVGLSATMLASSLGARVIAVDISPERLKRASDFGADVVLNPNEVNLEQAVREVTHGRGAELILETSGASSAAQGALDLVATWGKICFVGLGAEVTFRTFETLRRQLTLLTTWTISTVELAKCADFVADRRLPIDDLFTDAWSLDEASAAYRWFDKQSSGKGVFEM